MNCNFFSDLILCTCSLSLALDESDVSKREADGAAPASELITFRKQQPPSS